MTSIFTFDEQWILAMGIALAIALLLFMSVKKRSGLSAHDRTRISAAWREAIKHMHTAHELHQKVRFAAKHALASEGLSQKEKHSLRDSWEAVSVGLVSGNESHWRNAVIRADAVLDLALRLRRFRGKTMAERMNAAARKYPAVEDAFRAHRLRNDLVHNATRGITEKETRWALQIFERALRALGMEI